jgi:hypothetical protein
MDELKRMTNDDFLEKWGHELTEAIRVDPYRVNGWGEIAGRRWRIIEWDEWANRGDYPKR